MAEPTTNAAHFEPDHDDVFGRIAGRYDLLCDLFSLGAHRLWKNHMARRLASREAATMLDLASGTGDIPLRFVRRRASSRSPPLPTFWVTDLSPAMLNLAKAKLKAGVQQFEYAIADAHDLRDFEADSIDLISISFGMKICDRARVMNEALRLLKPGGAFLCLEAARIPWPWLHETYLAYMDWCLPLIARLAVSGDSSAYDYLLRGVHDFPNQDQFRDELMQAGFVGVAYENLTFGIVALHTAVKPPLNQGSGGDQGATG